MSLFSLVCFAALATALATVGVDVSQRTPLSSWQCVKGYGYDFAIIRVYMSNGNCDSNGPANINDAWNAGMAHVDGYIFPCYSCGNAAGQVIFIFLNEKYFFLTSTVYIFRWMPPLITSMITM